MIRSYSSLCSSITCSALWIAALLVPFLVVNLLPKLARPLHGYA